MTTIHYREIVCDGHTFSAEVVDEQCTFDLQQFAQACGQSPDWILQLIEYDILAIDTPPENINSWVKMLFALVKHIVCNVTLTQALQLLR